MTYQEVLEQARTCMGKCHACPVCNGLACKNTVPGPGAKGLGTGAIRNYQKWQELCVNMDTICENGDVDTSYDFFGHKLTIPVMAGPVGAVAMHYSDKYDDLRYNNVLVEGCAKAGILAFTGDGTNPAVMEGAADALKANGGCGVPTVKPWNLETVRQKMDLVKAADPCAIAMDIDAAGLPFLKGMTPPAGSKTVDQLKDIAAMAGKPFILKGIMTVKGAEKALEAGAAGIIVSNHGGRVLDQCPATAEVLPAIVDAVGGSHPAPIPASGSPWTAASAPARTCSRLWPWVPMRCSSPAPSSPRSMAALRKACRPMWTSFRQSLRTPWPCAVLTVWLTLTALCSSAFE